MSGGLVARAAEDRAVAHFLDRVAVEPSGLVIEGEPGIGKTTLISEAASRASARGFRVLKARGAPSEVTYAYAAMADLLCSLDDSLWRHLPAVQRAALDRVVSGYGEGPATDERLVAEAFLSVLRTLSADAAVLICIDDTQWLDTSTQAVLGFAARRLSGPVGAIATVRTGEPNVGSVQRWLTFAHPDAVACITMQPLTVDGVHRLVADRLERTLPRPAIARIFEISNGNPLFAIELARAIADGPTHGAIDLPTSLAEIVRERVGRNDDEVAAVLLAAACAAEPSVELIGQATGHGVARATELLESIEDRGIVELEGNQVRFCHPLFATGVYAQASRTRRRAMHRSLAGVVDQPELKARHLALAATTGDAATVAALDAAAEATFARGAPAAAAELVELALRLGGDTAQRRIRAAELQFRAGNLVPARTHLQSTIEDLAPGTERCLALMLLGAVRGYDDDPAAGVEAMAKAVEEAGDNVALRLLCMLRLTLAMVMVNRIAEAVERARMAVTLADRVGVPGLRSQALSIWVAVTFVYGLGADHQALQTALELEDPDSGATTWFRASAVQAMISAYTGDLERAHSQIRAVRQQMFEAGTEVEIIWAAVHVAAIDVWMGRYRDAAEAAHEAVQRAEQMGGRLLLITTWTVQAAAAAYAGRDAEARAVATAAVDTARVIGSSRLAIEPLTTLGFLDVSAGEYAAALRTLQPLIDAFDPDHGLEIEGGAYLPDAVEALAATGRLDEAGRLVAALETGGSRLDRPWMLAVGARGRAHILAARGELDSAEEGAEEAVRQHLRVPMPFELARTQLLLGQIQRRRRRRAAARATLTAALRTFDDLGSPLWSARARDELKRLLPGSSPTPELTAAEHRVAERAAAGLSNREIAAELFLAPKTVEMNLSTVYRKLGIRSRAQLFARLNSSAADQSDPPRPENR
ncbi:LuxR family transcriptional regulator [Mycobacterium sp. Y57]|uniref:AAA family ATPase n=1 Tax=Mycolicibacterium xanthum TaxID=2796469 RepID=UPI001C85CFDA|nr:LuxR family transcriptional regulator [Mycolicibacterium xanthum]MBX7430632.1 LuxR family transcriptional regulator [Mycolicibacterium xanthum]